MLIPKTADRTFIETIILLLFFLAVIFAVFEVIKVFFGVFTFALIFAVSFYKPFESLVKKLDGKRKLAAIIYVVILLSIVTLPFIYVGTTISHHLHQSIYFVTHIKEFELSPLPVCVEKLPSVGDQINVSGKTFLLIQKKRSLLMK